MFIFESGFFTLSTLRFTKKEAISSRVPTISFFHCHEKFLNVLRIFWVLAGQIKVKEDKGSNEISYKLMILKRYRLKKVK